jgi:hypothetical protein
VGQEVNSLSDAKLKTSDASAFTNATNGGQVIVNNYISTGSANPNNARVPVADVARLLGKSAGEVANDFAVDPVNGTISMQMFQAEAQKNPELSGYLGQFSSLLGSSVASKIDTPAYTNYKVKLPNGKTLALSDVLSLQDLNGQTDACLLDNSFIQGRVSYAGQLDRDIYLGFDRSSTTANSNQHLTSSNTLAALSLNGGSSIVVPLRYQRMLQAVKTILTVDTFMNLAETGIMWAQRVKVQDVLDDEMDYREQLDSLTNKGANLMYTSERVVNDPYTGPVYQMLTASREVSPAQPLAALNSVDSVLKPLKDQANALKSAGKAVPADLQSQIDIFQKERDTVYSLLTSNNDVKNKLLNIPDVTRKNSYNIIDMWKDESNVGDPLRNANNLFFDPKLNLESSLKDVVYKNEQQLESAFGMQDANAKKLITITREINKIDDNRVDIVAKKSERSTIDKVFNFLQSKVMNNFVMGYLWLGAGRFSLSMARGFTLQSNGKLLADNYLQVMANRNDVLKEFRDSTNWALGGSILEQVSSILGSGAPREVFGVGPMILINSPYETPTEKTGAGSTTSLQYTGISWQVTSSWSGKSDATLFEDIRDDPRYARMPVYVSNMTLGTNLNKDNLGDEYYASLLILAPIFAWKLMRTPSEAFIPISRVLLLDLYISNLVDPVTFSPNEACKDEVVRNYITYYAAATAASQVSNAMQMGFTMKWHTKLSFLKDFFDKARIPYGTASFPLNDQVAGLWHAVSYISPFDMLKAYYAEEGFRYTQTCKDTGYSIVAYQELSKKPKNSLSALAQKLNPLQSSNIVGNLSFGSALKGVGNALTTDAMTEIINTRMTMDSQAGMVRPSELYYLHLDGASEVSWGIYSALDKGGCFRKCEDGATMAVCQTDSGTYIIDKKTGAKTQISDRDRALMSTLMQDIAKTLIPNTLVSAQLACGADSVILQAGTDAHMKGTSGCATTECLMTQLAALSGLPMSGNDISSVMGDVSAVKTSNGLALFEKGKPIRFIYTSGTTTKTKKVSVLGPGFYEIDGIAVNENDTQVSESDRQAGYLTETTSKVGTEVSSPSIGAQDAVDSGTMTSADAFDSALLSIKGDASVTLSGFTSGTDYGAEDAGTLESVIFKRGRIEYDKANNRLVAALYILGEADFAKSVDGVMVTATKNVNENGTNNAIRIEKLTAKPGMEDQVNELNKALQQVQGSGGMQMLETADHIYYFTKNAAGEDVLKLCDKKTSTCKEYRITGAISSDGSTITVPTEKGDFRLSFGTNSATGFPEINVSGPDGFKEIATLLAARGQNGIFVFDPYTGLAKILNGQDLSLSGDFASKGMSFYGTSDGTRGIAGSNYVGLARSSGTGASSSSSPLSIPSVPFDNLPVAALMLLSLLGVVVAVRAYGQ